MTMSNGARNMTEKRTAKVAYDEQVAEAIRRTGILTGYLHSIKNLGLGAAQPHWGHVGDLDEINAALKQALHYAGITEFVEK